MPVYQFDCPNCGAYLTQILPIERRNDPRFCPQCSEPLRRRVDGPYGRVRGRADGKPDPGGPDQFTADMLGVPVKDLPINLKVKVGGKG